MTVYAEDHIEEAIKYIDELVNSIAKRPRMHIAGDSFFAAEQSILNLLDVRAILLGNDPPDWKAYCKKTYPDIPGSIRSIAYGSAGDYDDKRYKAFIQAMQEMVEALR